MSICLFFFLMLRRLPISTPASTLLPDTTLCRSHTARPDDRRIGMGRDGQRSTGARQRGHLRYAGHGTGTEHRPATAMFHHRGDAGEGVRRIERRSEEHTYELQSLMRNSYAVFCLNKTKYKHIRNTRNL